MAAKRGARARPSPTKPEKARKAKVSPAVERAADRAEERSQVKATKPKDKNRTRPRTGDAAARQVHKRPVKAVRPRARPKAGGDLAPVARTPEPEAPRRRGRPTDYDPELCDLVRALGTEGKGAAEIAAELGISRQTWYDWQEARAEFLDAVKDARWLAQAWFERKGRSGIDLGKNFNAQAWRFQMENRFSEDYRQTKVVHNTHHESVGALMDELDGQSGRFRQAA